MFLKKVLRKRQVKLKNSKNAIFLCYNNNGDSMYAEDEKKYKVIRNVIGVGVLIVLIALIIYLLIPRFKNKPIKNNDFEKRIIADAETYIRVKKINRSQFITLADIEEIVPTSYDTCNKSTGVYYHNNTFDLYVKCSKYESEIIETINSKEYKYITLKEDSFVVTSNAKYQDPGYTSNYNVSVTRPALTEQGIYQTTYLVKNAKGEELEKAERYILYAKYNDTLKKAKMSLNGEKEMYVKKGTSFKDPGVSITYEDGSAVLDKVITTGKVDTSVAGEYLITYTLNQLKETRLVVVTEMNITAELSTSLPTNRNLTIEISIASNNYNSTILPDQTETTERNISYEVNSNGVYKFIVVDNNYNRTEITKEVTNIDRVKPSVKCTGKSENNNTAIYVTAEDSSGIKSYNYGSGETSENTYVVNKTLYASFVTVTDNAGNKTEASCTIDVIVPTKPEETNDARSDITSSGAYKRIRLTYFDDSGLAKCGTKCVQNKIKSGDIKLDEHGWYMYKYKGEWYYVIATAINQQNLIQRYGDLSYTDITYYNYYDTFTVYISDTSSSSSLSSPDSRFKAYRVIILDVCGACSKFSVNLKDQHPGWSTSTINKWRRDAKLGNSIKLDLWVSKDNATKPADWAFIDR